MQRCKRIILSQLPHTWILDIDGTVVKHNGYKIDGYDTLLEGAKEFFEQIPKTDKIILLTAREGINLESLKVFLKKHNIRYDYILPDMPMGERVLINDIKPSGLQTAYAVNKVRDEKLNIPFEISEEL